MKKRLLRILALSLACAVAAFAPGSAHAAGNVLSSLFGNTLSGSNGGLTLQRASGVFPEDAEVLKALDLPQGELLWISPSPDGAVWLGVLPDQLLTGGVFAYDAAKKTARFLPMNSGDAEMIEQLMKSSKGSAAKIVLGYRMDKVEAQWATNGRYVLLDSVLAGLTLLADLETNQLSVLAVNAALYPSFLDENTVCLFADDYFRSHRCDTKEAEQLKSLEETGLSGRVISAMAGNGNGGLFLFTQASALVNGVLMFDYYPATVTVSGDAMKAREGAPIRFSNGRLSLEAANGGAVFLIMSNNIIKKGALLGVMGEGGDGGSVAQLLSIPSLNADRAVKESAVPTGQRVLVLGADLFPNGKTAALYCMDNQNMDSADGYAILLMDMETLALKKITIPEELCSGLLGSEGFQVISPVTLMMYDRTERKVLPCTILEE